MQSEPRKNPYLVQYKENLTAKQKSIRERIGSTGPASRDSANRSNTAIDQSTPVTATTTTTSTSTSTSTTVNANVTPRSRTQSSRDNIPSIDDEISEQVSNERRFKGRFSYFTDEAEASLQFFKENLLPRSESSAKNTTAFHGPARGSLFDVPRRYSPISAETNATTLAKKSLSELKSGADAEPRPRPLSDRYAELGSRPADVVKANGALSGAKQTSSSVRPVPFKQTSLEGLPPRVADRASALAQPRAYPTSRDVTKHSRDQLTHREHNEQQVPRLLRPPAPLPPPPQQVKRELPTPELAKSNLLARGSRPPADGVELTRGAAFERGGRGQTSQRSEGTAATDSPAPSAGGTFSRRPLYNSLLRAHDSIRLKVNRPKVRSDGSKVAPVEDTVVDDSIELAEIVNDEREKHEERGSPVSREGDERAVDVKRSSSRRGKSKANKANKSKSAGDSSAAKPGSPDYKTPVRQFAEVRVVEVIRSATERSLGVTVRAEDGHIVVARIMAGSLADKQGALQVGDIILAVNNREVYTPEQLQEELRKNLNEDSVLLKIVPSYREELPTLCIYLRALFNYDANEDSLLPCKEVGVSFNQGDILEVVNQEDPNWWQARRVDSENLQTGLIPSQELEERRRAFVIPDYDLATRTSICGTKVSKKSKKKEIYNLNSNNDFDKAELQLYEEVCRTPAFERRTLVLIGANSVGKQALKARLINFDPERFGAPLPHTSRLPREGEEDGLHYHFVTRERMEEDIIAGKYLEYGEYDGALYGTKLDSVREIIASGKVCVLDCSPTCLKLLKTSDYLPFVAFIAAPTLDQLRYSQDNYGRLGSVGKTNINNYSTFDRALSRQSRRAKTLQDFAFDFFEDEDLQQIVEESARLFRIYENYFDIVLVNNHFETTFLQLKDAIDALSMAPQWIPISWIYGT